jgi:hypothetical protein
MRTCKQIIAPSPIPSLKLKKDSVESKRVYSVESSGYETSPVISSSQLAKLIKNETDHLLLL